MSLTKEQLLISRVMCVGTEPGTPNYPGSEFNTGDILMETIRLLYSKVGQESCRISKGMLDRFPHLFRPMPWWEGRKPEDMPEYIKYGQGAVYKVIEWKENEHYGVYALCERGEDYPLIMQPQTSPATEQEYLDYKGLRKCPDCDSTWKGDERCPECFPV